MQREGLSCSTCRAGIPVRALDRERGWAQCEYCDSVERLGALPVEAEESPGRRMLLIHRGEETELVVRPPGGPGWLYPAIGCFCLVVLVAALTDLRHERPGEAFLTALWLAAPAALLFARRTERQLDIDDRFITHSRHFRGRRLWTLRLSRAEAQVPVVRRGGIDTLALGREFPRRIRFHLWSRDESRWLESALRDALTPNRSEGKVPCEICGAELDVTRRRRERVAFNCQYCGAGLALEEGRLRIPPVALESDFDLEDRTSLFEPGGVTTTLRGGAARAWDLELEDGFLRAGGALAAVAMLVVGPLWWFRAEAAEAWRLGSEVSTRSLSAGLVACLGAMLLGAAWRSCSHRYARIRASLEETTLHLEELMFGVSLLELHLPLAALVRVAVEEDYSTESVVLVVETGWRRVQIFWPRAGIHTPTFTSELFEALDGRLRELGRTVRLRTPYRQHLIAPDGEVHDLRG